MSAAWRPKVGQLLGLPSEWRVTKISRRDGADVAYVSREVTEADRVCPVCGRPRCRIRDRRRRKIWHTPVRGVPLLLIDYYAA